MAGRTRTGPTTTDGTCCVHVRGFMLVCSAFDTSGTVILTSVLVISTAVRVELARSTASSTTCPR